MQEALREWAVEHSHAFGEEGKFKPQLRIGINTGPVVAGLFAGGGAQNYTAVGDTVNVASRLETRCEPGRILTDATTVNHTNHLIEFDEELELAVKGRHEPVRARHVIRVKPERGRVRGFEGQHTTLVGRSKELSRLQAAWQKARKGEFQLCLITGAAGIGKTRLLEELVGSEEASSVPIAIGRSYPYSSSTPWEPVAELLRSKHNLQVDVAPKDAATMVISGAPEPWSPQLEAGLAIALGSPVSEVTELQGYSPTERQEWIRKAVIRSLGSGEGSPAMLVLEDLHWADQTTLEALSRLQETKLPGPVMVVLISRPPLSHETALNRLVETVEDRIDLKPLSQVELRQLTESLLGEHELPGSFLDRIAERAEGIPLFLEEVLKSLAANEAIRREDDVWKAEGDLDQLSVPDTIESVLSTRIDGLDNAAKSVLQYAAIVGRRFWNGVLAEALVQRPVDSELDTLMDGAFVRSLPFSTVSGDREFLFEHLLLQEVAYEGMLRRLRTELHGAVAEWLENRLGEGASEYAEWIAFHHERSAEPDRALPYLEKAADTARERGSLSDARALVERALGLAADPTAKARLLLITEDIAAEAGEQDDDRIAAEAEYRRARFQLHSGDLSGAHANGEKSLARFEEIGDISMQADVLRLLARVSHLWGDQREALKYYRSSLPLEREAGDRYGQAEVFDQLGLVQIDLDDFATALDYFEAAREICAEIGQRPAEARIIGHQAWALHWVGRYEEAEKSARMALELAERCGSLQAQSGSKLALAAALAALGENAEAETLARQVCEVAEQAHQPGLGARAYLQLAQIQTGSASAKASKQARQLARLAGLAHVDILAVTREAELALEAGDVESAEEASAEAMHKLSMRGKIEGPEEAVLFTRSRSLEAQGRGDEAAEVLEQARAAIREKAAKIGDSDIRQSFLEIPLNREALGEAAVE
jgi:class 3 adenylate cyclase